MKPNLIEIYPVGMVLAVAVMRIKLQTTEGLYLVKKM